MKPEQGRPVSFEEFKETLLRHGSDDDIYSRVAQVHGRIPRLIRLLHNIDPSGISSAIDQLLSEKVSEQEQENIIRAIYVLANKIWSLESGDMPSLPDDKFEFLYYVYERSETDVYMRVEADEMQNLLGISQNRTIAIAQYLDQHGFIEFETWVQGIKILHDGIVKVEASIWKNDTLPACVSEEMIGKIEERMRLRFSVLQCMHDEVEGDIFAQIQHVQLAEKLSIKHHDLISQILPYLAGEGWVNWRTSDSVAITEEGVDRIKALLA
jgi:Mn-dependent DtxR family transcriptional regulator